MAEKDDEKRAEGRRDVGMPRPAVSRDPGKGAVMRKSLPRTTRGLSAPVQRQSDGDHDVTTRAVQDAAGAGTATASGPLPHQATLEASFGRDLSGIQAHTGPDAQASAAAIGAQAYATGDHIVAPPGASLGLVAHEVTHVLQQQQGVQLKGGIDGGASDPYEQEADDVAAAVERGESVAHRFAGGTGHAAAGTVQRDAKPAGAAGGPPDIAAQVRLQKMQAGLVNVTSRWKNKKDLDPISAIEKPTADVSRFQQAAYELLAVDQSDMRPLKEVLEGPNREPYLKAFEEVLGFLQNDVQHHLAIQEDVQFLCSGGQVAHLSMRILANHARMTPCGKRSLASVDALGKGPLAKYIAERVDADNALEQQLGVGESDARRTDRRTGCEWVLNLLKTGTPPAKDDQAAAPAANRVFSDTDRNEAAEVIAEITQVASAAEPDPEAVQALIAKVGKLRLEVRDLVWADQKAIAAFVRAVAPGDASKLIGSLDPVEVLYKTCKARRDAGGETRAANAALRTLPAHAGEKLRDAVREEHKFAEGSSFGAEILGWLRARTAEDQRDLRGRLLSHTKLKDDFIDRLPPSENRLVYRLISRGTESPTAEDMIYEGAETKKGEMVIKGLRLLAGTKDGPKRLSELETDMAFRRAVEAMTTPVDVDGQMMRPYHFCLHIWGRDVGEQTDPGVAVLTEVNVEGAEPLSIEERIRLNTQLFDPALAELHDEVSGKNTRETIKNTGMFETHDLPMQVAMRGSGDPQKVQDILRKWDRLASNEFFLPLLRREGIVFGPELDARYFRAHNVALRTWIYQNAGPNNRSGANRVLGTEQGAAVGMFNGEMMLADDKRDLAPGKCSLQQALREVRFKAGDDEWPLYEWASVLSRKMKTEIEDGDKKNTLFYFDVFRRAVDFTHYEVRELTGISIRAIDLIRNAYLEHGGNLEVRIAKHFKGDDLAEIQKALGLYEGVDVAMGADAPPIAEQAQERFGEAAAMLWKAIGALGKGGDPSIFPLVQVARREAMKLPRIDGEAAKTDTPTAATGKDIEERPPRTFAGFYRAHYGVDPDHHLGAACRAMTDSYSVDTLASMFEIKKELIETPPVAPKGDDGTIGDHNRHLIGADFTEAHARSNAEKMWEILHGEGEGNLQTIEKELYGVYNDEEQRLIRVHFRRLSGGFDLTFYVRQAIDARQRIKAEAESKKSGSIGKLAGTSGVETYLAEQAAMRQSFSIGAEGTAEGQDALNPLHRYGLRTGGSEAELERALSVSMNGVIDPKTRLMNAIKRDSDDQVLAVIDELSSEERKAVLRDKALTDAIYGQLSQSNYERAFKTLTGQSDLADKMFSRSHGGSWWERKVTGGTDEAGMRNDIKAYLRKLRKQFDAEVRGEADARFGKPVPAQVLELIEKEIGRRMKEACTALISEKDVRSIMSSELEDDELMEMISMIANAGDARDWAVAGDGSDAQILAEIRGMSAAERAAKAEDPNYLRLLGQRVTDEKMYRDALAALRASSADQKSTLDGLTTLDEKSRTEAQVEGAGSRNADDNKATMRALVSLTPEEHAKLAADPAMQTQILAGLSEDDRKLALEILGRKPATTAGVDGKPLTEEAAKAAQQQFLVDQAVSRLTYECQLKYQWSDVIDAGVKIFTADLPKADGKDRGPRGVIWDRVVPAVRAYAKHHDSDRKDQTSDAITGDEMITVLEAAVLGKSDPSDYAVRAKIFTVEEQFARNKNADKVGNMTIKLDHQVSEEQLKSALENASDDHLIAHWTSVKQAPPGGGETMENSYLTYRRAFDDAKPAIEAREAAKNMPAPEPEPTAVEPPQPGQEPQMPKAPAWNKQLHALGDSDASIAQAELARQQFLLYVIRVSARFEEMLRPYMGDDRGLTQPNADPHAAKVSQTKNKRYNDLAEIIYARIPRIDADKLGAALGMKPEDTWLLRTGARSEVNTFNNRHEKNLRSTGAQSTKSGAQAEKEHLDSTIIDYGRGHRVALTDAHMTDAEIAQQAYLGDQNDQAREAYKTALEQAAMWATLIVGTLIAVVAAVLTGGLALGPLAMLAVGAATTALSASAKALIMEQTLGEEFDSKDKEKLITSEVITGLVSMGASFYAAKLFSTLGNFGKAAQQANAAKQIFGGAKPALWKVFLKEAGEEMTEEAMTGVVEAGLAATDPAHWVDGYRAGADQAKKAGLDRLASIPGDSLKSGVSSVLTSVLTRGAKKVRGKGGDEVDVEEPKMPGAKQRKVNVVKNIKEVFGAPEEKVSGALVSWAMNQESPIDWSKAPEGLLQSVIEEYGDTAKNIHVGTAQAGDRKKRIDKHLAIYGHDLSAAEKEAFSAMNSDAGNPFVTANDYARIRTEVAMNGLASWEGRDVQLNDEQKAAFVKYVREAKDADELARRAKEDPMKVPGMEALGSKTVGNAAKIDTNVGDHVSEFKGDVAGRELLDHGQVTAGALDAARNLAPVLAAIPDASSATIRAEEHTDGTTLIIVDLPADKGGPFTIRVRMRDKVDAHNAEFLELKNGHVLVDVSPGMRAQDVQRAITHEIAEILTLKLRGASNKDRLDKREIGDVVPAHAELSPHDIGRLAEMQLLLTQFDKETDAKVREDHLRELRVLVRHFGFMWGELDAGMKKLLGAEGTAALARAYASTGEKVQHTDINAKRAFFDWLKTARLSEKEGSAAAYRARLEDYFWIDPEGAIELARQHYGFGRGDGNATAPAEGDGPAVVSATPEDDARQMLGYLAVADPQYKGGNIDDEERRRFVERYKAGLLFDPVTRRWYVPGGASKEKPVFPKKSEGYTDEDVFKVLMGEQDRPVAEGAKEPSTKRETSFAPFVEMLALAGVEGGDADKIKKRIMQVIKASDWGDQYVEAVRHLVKSEFRKEVLHLLAWPDPARLGLQPGHSQEQYAEARFLHMRDALAPLHASDRGNLAESWSAEVRGIDDPTMLHTVVTPEIAAAGGVTGVGKNILDMVHGDEIIDNKDYDGDVGTEGNEAQLLEQLKLAGREDGKAKEFDVKDRQDGAAKDATAKIKVSRVRWCLTDPAGALASAKWMRKMLRANPEHLVFELHTWDGGTITVPGDLDPEELVDAKGNPSDTLVELIGTRRDRT